MSVQSHTVYAVFTFKDKQCKSNFFEFLKGDKGMKVIREWPGCQSFDFYESLENPLKVTIWQKWDSKENHESYVKMRHEEGSFEMLKDWVESPPEIVSLRPVNLQTDEEKVEDVVRDMCNVDYKLGMRHMHDDCVFVRPSGNPLSKKGWEEMMTNDDVNVELQKLVSINKLQVVGDMAYVCYTTHGKFTYKGTENDDIAVLTCVMKKFNGKWMMMMGQRSTGRKPEESLPQF